VSPQNETYSVPVVCSNCMPPGRRPIALQRRVEVPKGMTINEALASETCPNCGCKTVVWEGRW
jgi:hypothetical protein